MINTCVDTQYQQLATLNPLETYAMGLRAANPSIGPGESSLSQYNHSIPNSAKPIGVITQEAETLDKQLSMLSEKLNTLWNVLAPIVSPIPATERSKRPEYSIAFANTLGGFNERLSASLENLEILINGIGL